MKPPASTMASAYRAGKSAGQNYVDVHRETVKYANKPAEINKVAYQAQMAEKTVATEVNKRAKIAEMDAQNYTDRINVRLDRAKKLEAAKSTTRKAGMLGAAGLLASEAIREGRMPEAPRRERPDDSISRDYYTKAQATLDADVAKNIERTEADQAKWATLDNPSTNANASVNTSALNTKAVGGGGIGGTDMDYMSSLVSKGFQPINAAAIVGNARYETGDFKFSEEKELNAYGTKGYGALQWSNTGDSKRRDNFINYAKSKDLSPTSFEANAGFISHEMTHGDPQGRSHWTAGANLAGFKGITDLGAATDYYAKRYLRPAEETANYAQRRSNAMDTYTRYMQSQ